MIYLDLIYNFFSNYKLGFYMQPDSIGSFHQRTTALTPTTLSEASSLGLGSTPDSIERMSSPASAELEGLRTEISSMRVPYGFLRKTVKFTFYALGFAALSYGFGTLLQFIGGSLASASFAARIFTQVGQGFRLIGKLIPAAFIFAIETMCYTFPKWILTKVIPKLCELGISLFEIVEKAVLSCVHYLFKGLAVAAEFGLDLLLKIGHRLIETTRLFQQYVFQPLLNLLQSFGRICSSYLLQPALRLLTSIVSGFDFVFREFLIPFFNIALPKISWALNLISQGISWMWKQISSFILEPLKSLTAEAGRLLWYGMNGMVRHLILPLCNFIHVSASFLLNHVWVMTKAFVTHICLPLMSHFWNVTKIGFQFLSNSAEWIGQQLFPILRFGCDMISIISQKGWDVLSTVYTSLVIPFATLAWNVIESIGSALMALSSWSYQSIFIPFKLFASNALIALSHLASEGFNLISAALSSSWQLVEVTYISLKTEIYHLLNEIRGFFVRL